MMTDAVFLKDRCKLRSDIRWSLINLPGVVTYLTQERSGAKVSRRKLIIENGTL